MIVLSKDMEVGVKRIDDQHRELVNRLNIVSSMGARAVSVEETSKTINMLGDYIIKHFNDEEGMQVQSRYPKYETHKKLHEHFKAEYQKLRAAFIKQGPSAQFTLDLNKALVTWIVKHIKSEDIEFGKYYNSKNA